MEVSRFHRWWLGACVIAMLIANWVGGFSVAVTAVFVIIYLTGATLIRQGEGVPETDAQPEPEPYPQDDSNEAPPVTAESESTPG